eukprot:354988-Chlamydomonas_euryale.AAC.12
MLSGCKSGKSNIKRRCAASTVICPMAQLHFTPDARESEAKLFHRLRLHEDDGSQSTKKPVVNENYEEVIFSEPHEDFYLRVSKHVPQPTAALVTHLQWLPPNNEAEELQRIQAARMRVAAMAAANRSSQADITTS